MAKISVPSRGEWGVLLDGDGSITPISVSFRPFSR